MSDRPRDAAHAHEDAHEAVAAARAARDRSAQIVLETALRRERAGDRPLQVDPGTEAVLRAHLDKSPAEDTGGPADA